MVSGDMLYWNVGPSAKMCGLPRQVVSNCSGLSRQVSLYIVSVTHYVEDHDVNLYLQPFGKYAHVHIHIHSYLLFVIWQVKPRSPFVNMSDDAKEPQKKEYVPPDDDVLYMAPELRMKPRFGNVKNWALLCNRSTITKKGGISYFIETLSFYSLSLKWKQKIVPCCFYLRLGE